MASNTCPSKKKILTGRQQGSKKHFDEVFFSVYDHVIKLTFIIIYNVVCSFFFLFFLLTFTGAVFNCEATYETESG